MTPERLRIRTYQVGFGDCFLLSFFYAGGDARHILVDFGSTGLPPGTPSGHMLKVARNVAESCDGKLTAVVATHRHKDHISGFATKSKADGPDQSGDVIRALKPDLVLQPWTEDPNLQPNATGPATAAAAATAAHLPGLTGRTASLANMQKVADQAFALARSDALPAEVKGQIEFLGDDNGLANRSAIENLMTMGTNRYLHCGADSGLEALIPGVITHVLGPPTVVQDASIKKERSSDAHEFWQLRAMVGQGEVETGSSSESSLFDKQFVESGGGGEYPEQARWLVYHARKMRGDQMLGLVRMLDEAMNNTSLILVFDVGGKRFLFPGDAQIENWSYALKQEKYRTLLAGVDLYKVGHHGSRNATPKSLWELFAHRSKDQGSRDRLASLMSTMPGKHGDILHKSEVPRTTLKHELEAETDLFTTETLGSGDLFHDTDIRLG
jgi:hypothetical protein